MANCFPGADLSHKQHFPCTPEVMTSCLFIPEVQGWTESDDQKWYCTSGHHFWSDFAPVIQSHSGLVSQVR